MKSFISSLLAFLSLGSLIVEPIDQLQLQADAACAVSYASLLAVDAPKPSPTPVVPQAKPIGEAPKPHECPCTKAGRKCKCENCDGKCQPKAQPAPRPIPQPIYVPPRPVQTQPMVIYRRSGRR